MNLKQYRCDMADKLGISEAGFCSMMYSHRDLYYPKVRRINKRVVQVIEVPRIDFRPRKTLKEFVFEMATKLGITEDAFRARMYRNRRLYYPVVERLTEKIVYVTGPPKATL